MNYAELKKTDIANGEGVRVSLFVSGCRRHCKGCFNEIAWDFAYGKPFDEAAEKEVMEALAPSFIRGLTLLGGDPFEPENHGALFPFVKKVKERFPEKDIWCFTGYTYDDGDILEPHARTEGDEGVHLASRRPCGREVRGGRSRTSASCFRGSSNQRVIDVQKKSAKS